MQELATAKVEQIAAKAMILNNQHLGMVVQWEDRFYKSNRGHTFLGNPQQPDAIYPDYVQICAGFGVTCERVIRKEDLRPAMERMLAAKECYVLDVMVPYHGARATDDPGRADVQGHYRRLEADEIKM